MTVATRFGFEHIEHLSDDRGLFEHADHTTLRAEHGYCTDDNARLLAITSREADIGLPSPLSRLALDFVLDAQDNSGRFRNRMNAAGAWTDEPSTDDCWGRSLWGLGTAAAQHADPLIRRRAMAGFDVGVQQRSRYPRAMAFATLGAAEVLTRHPDHDGATLLLEDTLESIGPLISTVWRWTESRLEYANAALAEAVIAAGSILDSRSDLSNGLAMLAWLLDRQTVHGHLSVTGVGGEGPGDAGPMFDQQPIEVAALADACWRALQITGDKTWATGIIHAGRWFTGDNDANVIMYDDISGGGYDGLEPNSANLNQGAESTLALISTMQRVRSIATK